MKDTVRLITGDKLADKVPPLWGLDDEGEINGMWKYHGVPNAYFMTGMSTASIKIVC